MENTEQIAHLTKDLNSLFERYYNEYDLTYAEMVGVLEIKKAILIEECLGFSFEVDDEAGPEEPA